MIKLKCEQCGGVAIGGSVKGAIIVTGDKQVVIAEVDDEDIS